MVFRRASTVIINLVGVKLRLNAISPHLCLPPFEPVSGDFDEPRLARNQHFQHQWKYIFWHRQNPREPLRSLVKYTGGARLKVPSIRFVEIGARDESEVDRLDIQAVRT
jgi:hypothetical protein